MDELQTPSIAEVFLQHLASSGFPNLRHEEEDAAVEEDTESDANIGPIEPPPLERGLRQDDYQQIMNCGHVDSMTDIASSSAPEVTSSYVTTWVRVGVSRARTVKAHCPERLYFLFLPPSWLFFHLLSACPAVGERTGGRSTVLEPLLCCTYK